MKRRGGGGQEEENRGKPGLLKVERTQESMKIEGWYDAILRKISDFRDAIANDAQKPKPGKNEGRGVKKA